MALPIAPNVTKGLGPKPPKAEKPDDYGRVPPGVNSAKAQAAVMHKRRLSASGEALYDGRLCRALYLTSFIS